MLDEEFILFMDEGKNRYQEIMKLNNIRAKKLKNL